MAAQRLRVFRIVLASPADVEPEWKVVEQVVDELNHGLAGEKRVLLRISSWKTDSHPGFHAEGPQGMIDQTLTIETADVLLAIFWTRFGTPVADAASGTQHETLRALESWRLRGVPNVMVYFKEAPYSPKSQAEHAQWAQVRAFRDSFPQGGLWGAFRTRTQFETQLRRDLTNVLRRLSPAARKSGVPSSRRSSEAGSALAPADEPLQFTAEFSFIPRSSSAADHEFTFNMLVSNWSKQKLVDYDVELSFPGEFLSGARPTAVDESVSTPSRAVLRVPMPPNIAPPPVFPGQTRNVLSFNYSITARQIASEPTMLSRVEGVLRLPNGQSIPVAATMSELHNSQLINGSLVRTSGQDEYYDVGYDANRHLNSIERFFNRLGSLGEG